MADAEKVLEETIEEFALKARSFGKREELVALAELAFEASEARQEGRDVPDEKVHGIIHPSRLHGLLASDE